MSVKHLFTEGIITRILRREVGYFNVLTLPRPCHLAAVLGTSGWVTNVTVGRVPSNNGEHNTHWEALVPASLTLSMVLPMPLARMFPSIVNILSADIPSIPLISNIPTLTPTWSSDRQRVLVLGNLSLLYLFRSKHCQCIIIAMISLVSGLQCWHWVLVTAA